MLEKSNTWPEQVLDTLNSCWRALLESLSNTQANVRRWSLCGSVDAPRAPEGGCIALYDVVACMAVWLYRLYALYSVTGEP